MKTLIKITLVLCLFGSVGLADGDMGSGNYQCPPQGCPPPPTCTENCGMAQGQEEGTLKTTMTTSAPELDTPQLTENIVTGTLYMLF